MSKIIKFGTKHCGQCNMISKLLHDKGLEFTDIDCEDGTDDTEVLMQSYNIKNHVPVVIVRDDNGYEKRLLNLAEVKEWISHIM